MKRLIRAVLIILLFSASSIRATAQAILPTPQKVESNGPCRETPDKIYLTLLCADSIRLTLPDLPFVEELAGCEVIKVKYNTLTDSLLPESYMLEISGDSVRISASDYNGFIYALHSLSQIVNTEGAVMPERMTITDGPRCRWRAFMLDSGRQKQSVDTIKRLIRLMSRLKMNRFHWHLTEGLGWRPEIDAYPLLTEKGAFTAKGPQQQGYYSKEQMRDIVTYAKKWGVEIMPEIDLPGHSESALVAYPWMSCRGEAPVVPETGFTDRIFCAGKDTVVQALKIILDEICDVFPGEFIHLGGDEAPKGEWAKCPDCQKRIMSEGLNDTHDLQLWLSRELALHLKERGRKAMFWGDVVLKPGMELPENVVIQWWDSRNKGDLEVRRALERGHNLVLSPNYYCYLNFPESPWRGYGPERTFNYEKAYLQNPADKAIGEHGGEVLGITCALWTDYGLTEDLINDRVFPRIFALTELMWHNDVAQ